ncbi:choice-of-anchor D domain-containing protein [Akkermansiaceae bacterium]|nr:choice-of-anchor D domain-containing protein [Akkermansiaceae bacterium]MDB4541456.1 choice-of-anchor D domain-containing protein [Akkermansiaceae bacterium]
MKNTRLIALLLGSSTAFSSAEVIWEEDFDTVEINTYATNNSMGNVGLANTLTGEVTATIPAGFTSASGNVALLSTGTSQWAALRPASNPIDLPAIANGGTWILSFDLFIPADVANPVGGIRNFRWKDGGANNANGPSTLDFETLAAGEHNITYTGTFPIDNGNGPYLPINVRPFINFNQQDAGAAVSEYVYLDNLNFEVDLSNDDPNLISAPANFGTLIQSEGSYTRPMIVENSGTTNVLTLTGATISGGNAALFSLSPATFPISINPGESVTLEVNFDPADGLGDFSAQLELTSNDQSDPSLSFLLSGTTELPFEGRELIINGDFEAGDLNSWRPGNPAGYGDFTFSSTTVRNGTGAAFFSTRLENEWGSVRLATTPPLGLLDTPEHLAVTPEMIGSTLSYSGWYYRPSTGGMSDEDTVGLSFRWNGVQAGGVTPITVPCIEVPHDTWVRIAATTIIPEMDSEGTPVTSFLPTLSFRDVNADNPGLLMMFIDDISLKTDAPLPILLVDPVITEFTVNLSQDLIELTWTSNVGATYAVERSTDLENWVELDDSVIPSEATHTYADPGVSTLEGTEYFYRVTKIEDAP